MKGRPKVLVIGLDGATWDLIKPWAEEGKLPNIKRLMDGGVYGNLESVQPPSTGPAWTSFVTGKVPINHCLYDFVSIQKSLIGCFKPVTKKYINSKTLEEMLEKNGLRSILINLPYSYPPRTNDIILPSFVAVSYTHLTLPTTERV